MSEIIERVAEAMYNRHAGKDDTWQSLNSFWRKTYLEKARAAIEAMREPTGNMIETGSEACQHLNSRWENSNECWKAMVDEALS